MFWGLGATSMRKSIVFIFSLLTCGFATFAAEARSKAAQYVIAEQVAVACEGPGTIDADAAIERDLTGDGQNDLIIDFRGISCQNNQNMSYGVQLCTVVVYVREGRLLKQKFETMSAEYVLVSGNPPSLRLYKHGGKPFRVRWDGQNFK
jgi:hypothetical protein